MQKIPSQRQLYEIIIDLNNKYERLQQTTIKVYVIKRRQIDTLNEMKNCQLLLRCI